MFHATSARLHRLARKIAAVRDVRAREYATWYGWTVTEVSPGIWRYRDPRFIQLKAVRATQATTTTGRTWSQAALAQRIHRLDPPAGNTGTARRWS